MTSPELAGWPGCGSSRRFIASAMGLVVVYFANLAPKTLEPLTAGCNPARVQSLQRFSGWALVIGGLGYSLVWLLAPIEFARVVSIAILGTCLLLVIARFAWTLRGRRQKQPSGGS